MLFIINELGFETLSSFLWCVKQFQSHSTLFGMQLRNCSH